MERDLDELAAVGAEDEEQPVQRIEQPGAGIGEEGLAAVLEAVPEQAVAALQRLERVAQVGIEVAVVVEVGDREAERGPAPEDAVDVGGGDRRQQSDGGTVRGPAAPPANGTPRGTDGTATGRAAVRRSSLVDNPARCGEARRTQVQVLSELGHWRPTQRHYATTKGPGVIPALRARRSATAFVSLVQGMR
ncbi:MAG TPA: hypothetical protein VL049_08505, partial [Candidatus Dormibacteraeota bacterium]|nr:hypothetical protein [Candidatus Dormibacteraeota bacterium]